MKKMMTMRSLMLATLVVASAAGPLAAQLPDPDPAEVAAVRRAVLDYVEGVYEMRPELIERGVHPDLDKYGYSLSPRTGDWSGSAMTFDELVALSRSWAEGQDLSGAPKIVEVHQVLDRVASAHLIASWGIDAFLLIRDDEGTWKIRHVAWQTHTPETIAALRSAMEAR